MNDLNSLLPEFARDQVELRGECWVWTARLNDQGYGVVRLPCSCGEAKRPLLAHRAVWESLNGPIEPGLQLDHVVDRGCVHRSCVNPAHLEPVTNRVNSLRGNGPTAVNARKTHCIHGHEFTPENTYVAASEPTKRKCRRCHADRARARPGKRPAWLEDRLQAAAGGSK